MQEWLADRVSWVQYPHIRPADQSTRDASKAGLRFTNQMPIGKRIDLFLFSTLLLLAGLVALFFVGIFIYCLL
ncbi:hypothetical protein ACFOFO_18505 [Undibacterium arcticum]|uniref:Uncharacterized protein n=2 Tax=Undibacterium arcticum TaxID=1762892 RepID=A0ABV7F776_9BURK